MAMLPQIVLFGDSITEQSFRPGGWGAALADTYSRKADIVVRGYGGYNTRQALLLLHHLFPLSGPTPPPVAVTIFFGANDAALLGRQSEKQHVPLNEYKDNLRKIISHLKQMSPNMVVVLIAPPPVDEDGRKLPRRTNEVTGTYARQCVELAEEMQIPCIDTWSVMQQTEGWQKSFLRDGLHLTEEGNGVVHIEVVQALNGAGLAADAINGAHPEIAFQSQGCSSSGNIDAFCPETASDHI